LTMQSEESCPGCKGSGRIHNLPCSVCRGTGKIPREKRLEVKIPAGVADGSRVRFAGQGSPGVRGGSNGDLYLLISIKSHPVFERKDDNLLVNIDLPLLIAILGGEIQVPTLNGHVMLKIPPETQNGKVFILNGKGMPHLNTSTFGNLLVKVNILLPTKLTAQEKELYKQLAKLQKN
jgi:molecular chaperone DnaJ